MRRSDEPAFPGPRMPSTRTGNASDRLSAMLASVDKIRIHTDTNANGRAFLDGVAAGIEAAADVCDLDIVSWFAPDESIYPPKDGE